MVVIFSLLNIQHAENAAAVVWRWVRASPGGPFTHETGCQERRQVLVGRERFKGLDASRENHVLFLPLLQHSHLMTTKSCTPDISPVISKVFLMSWHLAGGRGT